MLTGSAGKALQRFDNERIKSSINNKEFYKEEVVCIICGIIVCLFFVMRYDLAVGNCPGIKERYLFVSKVCSRLILLVLLVYYNIVEERKSKIFDYQNKRSCLIITGYENFDYVIDDDDKGFDANNFKRVCCCMRALNATDSKDVEYELMNRYISRFEKTLKLPIRDIHCMFRGEGGIVVMNTKVTAGSDDISEKFMQKFVLSIEDKFALKFGNLQDRVVVSMVDCTNCGKLDKGDDKGDIEFRLYKEENELYGSKLGSYLFVITASNLNKLIQRDVIFSYSLIEHIIRNAVIEVSRDIFFHKGRFAVDNIEAEIPITAESLFNVNEAQRSRTDWIMV